MRFYEIVLIIQNCEQASEGGELIRTYSLELA